MHSSRLAAVSLSLLLATTIATVVSHSRPAFGETGAFDGTYKGTSVRTRGNDSTCGNAEVRPATITVRDGRFRYLWNRSMNVFITVDVKPDGTVYGVERWGTRGSSVVARGTVTGTTLAFEFTGEWCDRRFTLTKSQP